MKKYLLLWVVMAIVSNVENIAIAQTGPPEPPGEHGSQTNEPGGNADLGVGVGFLISLSAAYGLKKIWKFHHDLEK